MDDPFRFDGLVVVVTGGGRGLGRAHCELLASRGAHVVVNDRGVAVDGSGASSAPADDTVAAILDAGGEATANTSDIATEDGAAALVAQALGVAGRIDAVVNNAGIDSDEAFADVTWELFQRQWLVNAGGTFLVTRAAWQHLVSARGRVVMTASSTGVYGAPRRTHYASSKGAVFGLMRALALEGVEHGVAVNAVCPMAYTRLAETFAPETSKMHELAAIASPNHVAPLVAWLSHPECSVTGKLFHAGGGRVTEVAVGEGRGVEWVSTTIEEVAGRLPEIMSRDGWAEPINSNDAARDYLLAAAARAGVEGVS